MLVEESSEGIKNINWCKVWRRVSLSIFLITTIGYFLPLLPMPSFIGGLLFALFGLFMLPSMANIALSTWLVSFIPGHVFIKFLLFFPVSFILGINTYLPSLFATPPSLMNARSGFSERVNVGGIKFFNEIGKNISQSDFVTPVNFFSSPVDVEFDMSAGGGGCGCSFFRAKWSRFRNIVDSFISSYQDKNKQRTTAVVWAYTIQERKEDSSVTLRIEVFRQERPEDKEMIAWFEKDNIPHRNVSTYKQSGFDFFLGTVAVFLHDNFWSKMPFLPNPYTAIDVEINDFLNKAIKLDK